MTAGARMGDWDVVVVGGGHAGCEAAHASARLGRRTALLTVKRGDIARMSCNPAIGGIAKGHMVREIDALGGLMGLITDRAGIQFKMLNRGRGPAVWSPRAQCDKQRYADEMLSLLDGVPLLEIVEGVARQALLEEGAVAGLELADGRVLGCRALVITPGTFLNGIIHIGDRQLEGGRIGEHAARALSECLGALGLERGRLKTGTPPRLHRDSIDWDLLAEAPGDDLPEPFSHWTGELELEQALCWTSNTNAQTHQVIRDNIARSPLYSGAIKGTGPRYCPSLEDKVVKFPEREAHHLFLEPEGRDSVEIYPNGVSTSLPAEVQEQFLRTIPGLERVHVLRPGYAVEYDHIVTDQIRGDLQVAALRGLFAAGQINGTSGYEEAAGQGLVAGLNAARFARGQEPVVFDRATAYLGVMVDDLCRVNPSEPYRMFTSRAEFRLLLRSDNADRRLTLLGERLGLVDAAAAEAVRGKEARLLAARRWLDTKRREGKLLVEWLRRPEVSSVDLLGWDETFAAMSLSAGELAELEAEVKYAGYVERQAMEVERLRRMEQRRIPTTFDYAAVTGLSNEARSRLQQRRPLTLGEAGRLAGVRQADVQLLLVVLSR